MDDLDVLVNVAGIGSTTNAPETPLEVWENVFAVNARGTFLCCKHAIPGMVARGGGSIVNVASVAALVGLRNRAAYSRVEGRRRSRSRARSRSTTSPTGSASTPSRPARSTRRGCGASSRTPASRSTRCARASRWAGSARRRRSPTRSSTSPPTAEFVDRHGAGDRRRPHRGLMLALVTDPGVAHSTRVADVAGRARPATARC